MQIRASVRCITVVCLGWLAVVSNVWAQSAAGPLPRIIVQWKQPASSLSSSVVEQKDRALRARQDRFGVAMQTLRTLGTGGEVIRLGRNVSKAEMQQLLADLSKDPAVEYAEVDRLLQPAFTPNDGQFGQQWYAFEPTGGLKLAEAWDTSTGAGIRVAVVDGGIRRHVDLVSNIVGGYDFVSDPFIANDGDGRDGDPSDPGDAVGAGVCAPGAPAMPSSWHGTFVAGVIAATGNNTNGIAGAAFGAKIVPIRVVGRCGALLSDVADGAIWAAGGYVPGMPSNPYPAQIVNLSLAAPGVCDMTAQRALASVRNYGALPVVAAGNFGADVANTIPASCPNAITVAATGRNGGRAPYSNFGSGVDVAAPGGDLRAGPAGGIFSTHNSGTTSPGLDTILAWEGTSFAAANASGVLALLMSQHHLRIEQAEELLKSSARPFSAPCSGCGVGILDAAAGVRAAASLPLVASLQGGPSVIKSAGFSPAFISTSTGDIFEYRLYRTTSRGEDAGYYSSRTPYFLHQYAPMGCPGETMIFRLVIFDGLGRTSSYEQRVMFVTDPYGGGLPQPCGT